MVNLEHYALTGLLLRSLLKNLDYAENPRLTGEETAQAYSDLACLRPLLGSTANLEMPAL